MLSVNHFYVTSHLHMATTFRLADGVNQVSERALLCFSGNIVYSNPSPLERLNNEEPRPVA